MRTTTFLGCALAILTWTTSHAAPSREIYLAGGGMALLVLDRDGDKATAPITPLDPWVPMFSLGKPRMDVAVDDQILTVSAVSLANEYNPETTSGQMAFRRSAALPGDYDKLLDTVLRNKIDEELYREADIGYLHRLDEPALIEYFQLSGHHETTPTASIPPRLLDIATSISASHPGDAHARVVYWDALVRNERYAELAKDLANWRDAVWRNPARWLRVSWCIANNELDSLNLSGAGRNAFDLIDETWSGKVDSQQLLQGMPELLGKTGYLSREGAVAFRAPNFLGVQVLAKLQRVYSILLLLKGRANESQELLISAYHLGRVLEVNRSTISQLIGYAIRSISIAGLEIHALNMDTDTRGLQQLIVRMEQLESQQLQPSGIFYEEVMGVQMGPSHRLEKETRRLVTEAKVSLLYAATAVRHGLMVSQKYPSTVYELATVAPPRRLIDPFTSSPLRLRKPGAGRDFAVYSAGPDRDDDAGTIVYDPTNGTISSGDVVSEVPAKPKFPFRRNGTFAATREEFQRQFPNGLPLDPFANNRARGLGISYAHPLRVYSFGPDTNEQDAVAAEGRAWAFSLPESQDYTRYAPTISYDPTNGIISHGDVFTIIPTHPGAAR